MTEFNDMVPARSFEGIDLETIIDCLINEGCFRTEEIKVLNDLRFKIKTRR